MTIGSSAPGTDLDRANSVSMSPVIPSWGRTCRIWGNDGIHCNRKLRLITECCRQTFLYLSQTSSSREQDCGIGHADNQSNNMCIVNVGLPSLFGAGVFTCAARISDDFCIRCGRAEAAARIKHPVGCECSVLLQKRECFLW